MAEIRVDQSHCNYHLARWLGDTWSILFTDAGRASRGGVGSQGQTLAVFEVAGLPIPDLVAHRAGSLLVFEIDATLKRAAQSLLRYREVEGWLLTELGKSNNVLATGPLLLGFCRTGITTDFQRYAAAIRQESTLVDVVAAFSGPRVPILDFGPSPALENEN